MPDWTIGKARKLLAAANDTGNLPTEANTELYAAAPSIIAWLCDRVEEWTELVELMRLDIRWKRVVLRPFGLLFRMIESDETVVYVGDSLPVQSFADVCVPTGVVLDTG